MACSETAKGGFNSESAARFSHCPKSVPKTFLELLYPVHGIGKVLILNFFAFKDLIKYILEILSVILTLKCFAH